MSDLAAKRDRLLAILREMPRAVVAFSGGIDSTVVAQAAFTALGDRAVAVTSDSPSVPRAELALARELAREWGLPTWDKPASPCLSSRLAPGLPVTRERTAMVEAAESYLRGLSLRECRVRLHEGELARVEVPPNEVARIASPQVREE